MMFNKENLYIGLKRVIYRTELERGICLVDHFGGAEGCEVVLCSDYKRCSIGSDDTLKDLEHRFNRLVKNRTYPNLGI